MSDPPGGHQALPTPERRRIAAGQGVTDAAYVAIVVVGGLLAASFVLSFQSVAEAGGLGIDYAYYRDVGARFLADGSYYLPRQLDGPYDVALMSDVLYPPSALLLFVPAALLPAFVWWGVPIALLAYTIARWRPSPWGWVAMLALFLWPRAHAAFLFGNTDMWAAAGVAAGLRWGWPAVLLTLKPVFAPLAFIGVRSHSWWVIAAMLSAYVILTMPMWLDYLNAVRNLQIGGDYALASVPVLLIPVVAWWARDRRSR